jgi:hypothetical protein
LGIISGSGVKKSEGLFAADKYQNDRKDNADDDTCGQGEIEGKVLAFVIEVTGKPPDPWYFPSQQYKTAYACDYQAYNDKNLADAGEIKHTLSLLRKFLLVVLLPFNCKNR